MPRIKSSIPRDEHVHLKERIKNDLVVYGEFKASEIISNSICQDDFIDIDDSNNVRKHHTYQASAAGGLIAHKDKHLSVDGVGSTTSSFATSSYTMSNASFIEQ